MLSQAQSAELKARVTSRLRELDLMVRALSSFVNSLTQPPCSRPISNPSPFNGSCDAQVDEELADYVCVLVQNDKNQQEISSVSPQTITQWHKNPQRL